VDKIYVRRQRFSSFDRLLVWIDCGYLVTSPCQWDRKLRPITTPDVEETEFRALQAWKISLDRVIDKTKTLGVSP
jgi:hypothetical protein